MGEDYGTNKGLSRNTAEGRRKDIEQVRELLKQGHDVYKVALMVGRSREFVRTHAPDLFKGKAPVYVKRTKYTYDWLPADEEANVLGYYVPTPDELRVRKAEVRYGEYYKITYLLQRTKMPLIWSDHALCLGTAVERFHAEVGRNVTILEVKTAPKVLDRD